MKVLVGGLIRDRIPQLEVYLRHLRELHVPVGSEIAWAFVLDNCSVAATALVLGMFPEAKTIVIEDGGARYERGNSTKPYRRMAWLRNLLRGAALQDGFDALLSVDSDIVTRPELLTSLLETGRPWVSAVVENSPGTRKAFNVMPLLPGRMFRIKHARPDLRQGGPAGLIGAVCLYRRDLLERVAYDERKNDAEDMLFAKAAHAAGFQGWHIPLELEHLMTESQLTVHLARCAVCAAVPALVT